MKIKFIKDEESDNNEAVLHIDEEFKNSFSLVHSNSDDGYYSYLFRVEGTEEELRIIREFCYKIMDAK